MGIMRTLAMASVALLGAGTVAAAADFREGLSAYNAGDYRTAWENWFELSLEGDSASQASLGFLYLRGLGVAPDYAEAAHWFHQAAETGEPTALFFLGALHLDGHGVPRDLPLAHMYCELAMNSGVEDGFECREQAAMTMTEEDFARADQLLQDWRRTHAERASGE